eukprot:gene5371-5760_t
MESLAITAICILSCVILLLLITIRNVSLRIFHIYLKGEQEAVASTPHRKINEVMKSLILPYHQNQGKSQYFYSRIKKQHFILSCLFEWGQYSQRVEHLSFALMHFLSSLVITTIFVFNSETFAQCSIIHHQANCESTSNDFTIRSLHRRFCRWNDEHSSCQLHLSFEDPSDLLPLFFLQLLLISLCQAPINCLFTYCAGQLRLLFDYHLFVVKERLLKTKDATQTRTSKSRPELDWLEDEEKQMSIEKKKSKPSNNYRSYVMLIDYNDEFRALQTNYTLLLRGIRLSILQKKIDFIRPVQEMDFLLNSSKLSNHFIRWEQRPSSFISQTSNILNYLNYKFQLLQYQCFTVSGDPADIRNFLSHCRQHHQSLVLRHLLLTRRTAHNLRNELNQLPVKKPLDYQEFDQQLLQYFLVFWQSGLSQEILKREYSRMTLERQRQRFLSYIFSATRSSLNTAYLFSCELNHSNLVKCFLLFIAAFSAASVAASTVYLVYFLPNNLYETWTEHIDHKSFVMVWMWTVFAIVEFVYLFWLLPLVTGFYELFLPRFINPSHNVLLQTLTKRVKYLLLKRSKYLSNIFSALQFFHPVVRLARLFPSSAVSRILFTLTDDDLPIAVLLQLAKSTHPIYKIWKLDYSNLRQDIWRDENPLVRHRLQLLLENWKIRGFYIYTQLVFFLDATVRLVLYGILRFPSEYLQRLLLEIVLSLLTFGALLLTSFYWNRNVVVSIVVIIVLLLVLFMCLDVCFGWSKSLSISYFSRLNQEYQQILKYRKKRSQVNVGKIHPTSTAVEDEEEQ